MSKVKRSIKINGTDIVLELSKATQINSSAEIIHLDKLPDGTWRLIYSGTTIPDFSKVESLEIVRQN